MRKFLLPILMILVTATFVFAQGVDPVDWGSLGVNVGVIGAIIMITQIIKPLFGETLKKFLVLVPIVFAVGASFILGGAEAFEDKIVNAFYWAAAAGYLFKIGQAGLKTFKKG